MTLSWMVAGSVFWPVMAMVMVMVQVGAAGADAAAAVGGTVIFGSGPCSRF
jgi:hypothetical protein